MIRVQARRRNLEAVPLPIYSTPERQPSVERDLDFMRERCGKVDVGALFKQYGKDKERFRAERHQAFARELGEWNPA